MATVSAKLMNARLAPRKTRLIVNLVKGKPVDRALEQLAFVIRRPADPIAKLLRSAIANALNNFNMVESNLYIKEFYVDEGVKLKRHRAAGFGRAREIQKKTSNIHVVLAEKVAGLKGEVVKKEQKHEHTHDEAPKTKKAMPEIKTELGKKAEGPKGTRRLFQRKAV